MATSPYLKAYLLASTNEILSMLYFFAPVPIWANSECLWITVSTKWNTLIKDNSLWFYSKFSNWTSDLRIAKAESSREGNKACGLVILRNLRISKRRGRLIWNALAYWCIDSSKLINPLTYSILASSWPDLFQLWTICWTCWVSAYAKMLKWIIRMIFYWTKKSFYCCLNVIRERYCWRRRDAYEETYSKFTIIFGRWDN